MGHYIAIEEAGDEPLLQGDIFKRTADHYERPWSTYGVIVTADCDLVRSKTKGVASYVPALMMEDYIWHHWKDGKFEKALQASSSRFVSKINNRLSKLGQTAAPISLEAALQWLGRVGLEGLHNELKITDNGQRKELASLVEELSTLQALIQSEVPDIALLQSCFCLKHKGKQIQPDDLSALADEVQSSVSSLPGDVFYLPLEHEEEETGLFLMLRYIRQIEISDISIRVADMTLRNPTAKRLGRIAAPYRYAITQNLARVFSDIGLPTAYEERRDASSRKFFKVTRLRSPR
ncbi:hypothetical protein [Bradyrhizobium sp. USDA 4473]